MSQISETPLIKLSFRKEVFLLKEYPRTISELKTICLEKFKRLQKYNPDSFEVSFSKDEENVTITSDEILLGLKNSALKVPLKFTVFKRDNDESLNSSKIIDFPLSQSFPITKVTNPYENITSKGEYKFSPQISKSNGDMSVELNKLMEVEDSEEANNQEKSTEKVKITEEIENENNRNNKEKAAGIERISSQGRSPMTSELISHFEANIPNIVNLVKEAILKQDESCENDVERGSNGPGVFIDEKKDNYEEEEKRNENSNDKMEEEKIIPKAEIVTFEIMLQNEGQIFGQIPLANASEEFPKLIITDKYKIVPERVTSSIPIIYIQFEILNKNEKPFPEGGKLSQIEKIFKSNTVQLPRIEPFDSCKAVIALKNPKEVKDYMLLFSVTHIRFGESNLSNICEVKIQVHPEPVNLSRYSEAQRELANRLRAIFPNKELVDLLDFCRDNPSLTYEELVEKLMNDQASLEDFEIKAKEINMILPVLKFEDIIASCKKFPSLPTDEIIIKLLEPKEQILDITSLQSMGIEIKSYELDEIRAKYPLLSHSDIKQLLIDHRAKIPSLLKFSEEERTKAQKIKALLPNIDFYLILLECIKIPRKSEDEICINFMYK